MAEIDTTNYFGVAATGNPYCLCLLSPSRPGEKLTRAQALNLAAYLVALADPTGERFPAVLEAVQNT